ncbi:Amidohydrolase family, putative [Verrucomicrobiia bacterium DG1235]|nr:Amidohydrolase family, putative [Verrucomicrobiae bacterium DG1235]
MEALGDASSIAENYQLDLDDVPVNSGVVLPPFYDIHFHWVQDDVREMPKESLLEWLERYTFPEEARFADPDYSEVKAKHFWSRILATGTLGGLCYSSIHSVALDAAMKYAPSGFRIGGSLMTMNCPGFLRQTVDEAVGAASYGAKTYGDRYCITPRFAPTTHPEVMTAAAKLAENSGLFQQTHLDETIAEIEWVLGIYSEIDGFDDIQNYTEIYERCGVLGPRTVMGHAIHLEPEELELLAKTDTALASCPTSNAPPEDFGLGSGLFNFEQVESHGIRWALASDIGGGPFLSMFDVIESFVQQNRQIGRSSATYTKALYRSTLAGAEILEYGEAKGNFAIGKEFDCIQCQSPEGMRIPSNAEESIAQLIGQVRTRSDYDALVSSAVLNGEVIFERAPLKA